MATTSATEEAKESLRVFEKAIQQVKETVLDANFWLATGVFAYELR